MDNNLKIVNYLGKHIGELINMHELSKAVKIPYATFYRTVQRMDGIVNLRTIGKSRIVSLNIENDIIKSYLTISSGEEKKEFLKKHHVINKIASELDTDDVVVLFGSYAKGVEREGSDIDLLVINNKGNKSISFSKYELLFRKKINPLFVTKSEFIQMLHDKEENVGKQALKHNIILNNPESFWEHVLHERLQKAI
jgi:predicted nucleotidyltransferase